MSLSAFKLTDRSMNILLFGVLLSHLGTYMVVPLMPIYLIQQKAMTIAGVGMILAVSPFTFQAGSLVGGWLADRIGRRIVIALGAWLNGAAIAGFAFFDGFWMFVAMGLISGIGVGLNAPSTKAAIATLASEKGTSTTAFSLRGIAANIGTAAAGLLTYYLLGGANSLIFYVSAGLYAALGIISWLLLPKGCGDAPCKTVPLRTYASIFKNKPFVVFSIVSIAVWALYMQLSLALPLRAEGVLADPGRVSLIWTVNSLIVIVLQTPVSRWLIDRIHPMYSLSLGVLFIGGGLGSLYWATSFYGLLLCGAVFIVGEMLLVPTMDSTVSRMGTAHLLGAFFGISNFVSGLGEGAGKFAGGQLLGMGTAAPWLVYAATAVTISAALVLLRFWKPIRTAVDKAGLEQPQIEEEKPAYPSMLDWVLGRKRKAK